MVLFLVGCPRLVFPILYREACLQRQGPATLTLGLYRAEGCHVFRGALRSLGISFGSEFQGGLMGIERMRTFSGLLAVGAVALEPTVGQ